jgi:hypothetical protein
VRGGGPEAARRGDIETIERRGNRTKTIRAGGGDG